MLMHKKYNKAEDNHYTSQDVIISRKDFNELMVVKLNIDSYIKTYDAIKPIAIKLQDIQIDFCYRKINNLIKSSVAETLNQELINTYLHCVNKYMHKINIAFPNNSINKDKILTLIDKYSQITNVYFNYRNTKSISIEKQTIEEILSIADQICRQAEFISNHIHKELQLLARKYVNK